MTVFRNDCHLCQIERPLITWIHEIGLVIGVGGGSLIVFFGVRRLISSALYQHFIMLLGIIFGFLTWIIALISSNQSYLQTYCLP